ncbi:MAG: TonB-dependent receptor [Bacteroidia bacterium]|nr:TonB-dependent receptor [Bacteroidia bacterium]
MRKLICFILFFWLMGTLQAVIFQESGSQIKGKVNDLSGNALPGTGITIDNTFWGVHADSGGNYSFAGLKDGVYTLRFSFIGYETQVREVMLKGEAVLNITLSAKPFMTEEVLINATRAGENAPLAYSTIGKELLKTQNIGQDMPYLLSLTPSLVETSEAGNGVGYTSLRIRGTDGNRINVTIDGIPLNDPESQQVFWVDLPDLASSVENIQVQRGAGTSSNGAGAFGATISIQTTNPENEPFAEVNSSMGSFNTLKNMVSAGTGLLGGKFAFQMRYSDIKSDGFIDRTGSNHRSAFITGIYRTEKFRLKANIILGEEHTGIGWWGVPKDSLTTNRRYNPSGEYTDEEGIRRYYDNESDNYYQNHYQLIYSLKLNNYLSFHTAVHYTKGKGYYEEYREDQPMADYGLTSFYIGDSVISSTDLIRRKWMSNDFYGLVYSLKYQKNRIEAITGGGMNLYLGDHFGKIIWMRNAGNTEKDYQWYFNNSRKSEISLYGKVNYSLSDKTSIFGDLQYRYVLYNMTGNDDDLKNIGQEHKFRFFNPKAGMFLSITPNQDAYFSFSVANREPTRSDYKEASGDPGSTPRPETLYDSEMGYKLRTGKSSFSINLYGMFYRDQLVPTGELSNVGYSIMTNVDKSYRLGLEMSAAIRLSDFIGWNVNLSLSRNKITNFVEHYIDYNTSDWSSEYLSKNLGVVDIAYSPSEICTSDFTFTFSRGVDLHLISKFVGKQYFDNTMNPDRTIDPYFVNNIRIDLAPRVKNIKGIEFQLLVNNFLNEIYENNAYGGNWYENGAEKTWAYYFPQAGINYMFKIGVKF